MMSAPNVFGDGLINPLPDYDPVEKIPYKGILYATDRRPATSDDEEKYYTNHRGDMLRVGVASMTLGDGNLDWEKIREVTMLTNRVEKIPVKISGVEEWGMLSSTLPFWFNLDLLGKNGVPVDATERFTKAINAQLARSDKKDVFIYVHGYKVTYENPLLISSELWHFLGYDGVFIAYAWPSTPSKFAYIKDSDTSAGFSRNLRLLIESIAKNTNAEEIHILGYSNGTRLVLRAMEQLSLLHHGETAEKIFEELRIGSVVLAGSDLDRGVFGEYVADGLLNVSKHMTIYLSDKDKALGISQFLTRRPRLGQMWDLEDDRLTPAVRQALEKNKNRISFIDVSRVEGVDSGNGHGYFQSSPSITSDVLMTLYYGLPPDLRGLVKMKDQPIDKFPPDYTARMWSSIEAVDKEFAERYRLYKEAQAK